MSLLDATVKVFYEDSLKFFLSLCDPCPPSRAAFGNVDETSFACIIRVAPRIALRRSAKSDADADTIYHGSELLAT